MDVAGGRAEDGIVIGNTFDKYGSKNPVVQRIMKGFDGALSGLVEKIAPATIHEVGCGEGYWVLDWNRKGVAARGTDFSSQVIGMAKANAAAEGFDPGIFQVASIYDVEQDRHQADLIVCCEVFEHLEDPHRGFVALQRIVTKDLVLSVPREPLWRTLNLARGRYVRDLGNTPGHLQHWSKAAIVRLANRYFEVIEVRSPLPWTMLHCRPKRRT